jgi:hypothetical protein
MRLPPAPPPWRPQLHLFQGFLQPRGSKLLKKLPGVPPLTEKVPVPVSNNPYPKTLLTQCMHTRTHPLLLCNLHDLGTALAFALLSCPRGSCLLELA